MGSLMVSGTVEATNRRRRGRRRSRGDRTGLVAVLLVLAVGAGGGAVAAQRAGVDLGDVIGDIRRGPAGPAPVVAAVPVPAGSPSVAPPPSTAAPATPRTLRYPDRGTGRFRTATATGRVAGRGGELMRYRVAVEDGIDEVDVERFGRDVAALLADPRGWTGDGRWRLQRVGPDSPADFTVLLTTPVTRSQLCGDLNDRYTSCRNGDRVVINVARWARGVPHFASDLATYRAYLLNHEVGHRLGEGHQLCPRRGGPAPVMQQQTLGLHGCTPNPWPQVNGERYAGPSGDYDDPIPTED
ncbi:DUF3152 domain-containing protein [Micromonospora sp. KC721]|uniref:DUF3152 domain-containing protein n=1 Tax=Micromonospora sp. KC721 TaxID=2530380 RepID=UPI001FB5CE6D|nr:DUF3152 domain-containing protein [Micromonospora sp. KC721]